ncbi:MAG: universal stress protein [Bacteroidetes bacterium]|nr:MAG: universal stress protein [Bacteroidota bacterium]
MPRKSQPTAPLKDRLRASSQVRNILLPTDFSPVSHNAFIYALHFAEQLGAEITLFHAYQDTPVTPGIVPEAFVDALRNDKIEAAQKQFEAYEAEVRDAFDNPIPVKTLLQAGRAAETIVSLSERGDIDMIVMGTLGAESMAEKLFGSVTTRVIESASCPVLAVPMGVQFEPIGHMLYATNFEEADFQVIDRLLGYADVFQARVSCAHIQSESEYWSRLDRSFFERIYQLEMEQDQVAFYSINSTDIVVGLQRFIAANKVDMIVMLCHQRPVVSRLLTESLTRAMTLHTDVPLMAFHF